MAPVNFIDFGRVKGYDPSDVFEPEISGLRIQRLNH